MTIYTKQNSGVGDHAAEGASAASLGKRGSAALSSGVSGPKAPMPPKGLFCLALNQADFTQDPVWTVIWQ